MFEEINILWGWKIWSWFVLKASEKFPNVIFNLITRNKNKFINHELSDVKNVNIYDYSDDVKKEIPCFYCISANEQKIIEEEWSRNKNINRMLILKYNIKIAYDMLPYINELNPSNLFIVTNPVEIVSTFLKNKLDWVKVYWLWLELDSKRVQDILLLFFDLNIDSNLYILWNHSFKPIPLLSNTLIYDKLKNITLSDILFNLKIKKNYKFWKTDIDFYKEFYDYINLECLDIWFNDLIPIYKVYDIINYFVNLLIRSEFNFNKPPIDNPIDSLVDTLSKFRSSDEYKVIKELFDDISLDSVEKTRIDLLKILVLMK